MLSCERVQELKAEGRCVYPAVPGDDDLGPLKLLPGTWKNLPNLAGRGWNMPIEQERTGGYAPPILFREFNSRG